jgi:ABC-2 type transport system ATP-binding protein
MAPVVAALSDVTKRFGNTVALDRLSLAVTRGELFALLGHNGAGKSTAISLLLGLRRPDHGSTRLFDQPSTSVAARTRVGVMMQDVTLAPELRVREHLALFSAYYPRPRRCDELLRSTGLTPLADRPYGALSGGQKRQVQFAIALCGNPDLLFLDEPTAGLDVETRERVWDSIRSLIAKGVTILLTTHYLEEAAHLASRVAVLAAGQLRAAGSVETIRGLVERVQITCKSVASADAIRQWPSVDSVAFEHGRLCIVARDGELVVRQLLANDSTLRELEVQRASLAQALADLTTIAPARVAIDQAAQEATR